MNYANILSRALDITRRNRALWLYGFLVALFGGGGSSIGQGFRFSFNSYGRHNQTAPYFSQGGPTPGWVIPLIIALVLFFLVWIIIGTIARYVSVAALIGMVRDVEETGATNVAEGRRWGWSVRAWRLFLIGLVVGIPMALIAILLMLVAFSPLILLLTGRAAVQVGSVALTVVLFVLVLLLLIVAGVLIDMVLEIVYRECVLNNRGVRKSLRRGFSLVREHLGPTLLMGLILLGLGWFWGILMIPVALILLGIAAAPALAVYAIAGVPAAVVVGVPLVVVVVLILSAIQGLYETFRSAAWTLTYVDLTTPTNTLAEKPIL
ncbi:MAG: hypothetical protein GXP41_11495 [Chloroflexi bacterium]|nr:hypothetical protein [Chloroflexota bacterium]